MKATLNSAALEARLEAAAAFFQQIAAAADSIDNHCYHMDAFEVGAADAERHVDMVRNAALRMGWLADTATKMLGHEPGRGAGAEEWLLAPGLREHLKRAAVTESGGAT